MAVYFMPRDRNNFWWGGGRGGGVLDLIGQALIQPMLQRDALARQYNYDNRLAQQKHDLDLAMKNAEWDRRDYEARRFIEGYNRDPRRSAGGGEMLAFLPGLGYKGNVSDVAQWALPQMATIDQGNQKTVAPIYSGGFIGNGETYDMGLSPKEAADVAIANGVLIWQSANSQTKVPVTGILQDRPRVAGGKRPTHSPELKVRLICTKRCQSLTKAATAAYLAFHLWAATGLRRRISWQEHTIWHSIFCAAR